VAEGASAAAQDASKQQQQQQLGSEVKPKQEAVKAELAAEPPAAHTDAKENGDVPAANGVTKAQQQQQQQEKEEEEEEGEGEEAEGSKSKGQRQRKRKQPSRPAGRSSGKQQQQQEEEEDGDGEADAEQPPAKRPTRQQQQQQQGSKASKAASRPPRPTSTSRKQPNKQQQQQQQEEEEEQEQEAEDGPAAKGAGRSKDSKRRSRKDSNKTVLLRELQLAPEVAAALVEDRPRRRAAADAVAKMAEQSAGGQRGLAAAVAVAAGQLPGAGSETEAGSVGDGQTAATGGLTATSGKSKGRSKRARAEPYVLPPDADAGCWEIVAEDLPGFLALAEKLLGSGRPEDQLVGQMVQEAAGEGRAQGWHTLEGLFVGLLTATLHAARNQGSAVVGANLNMHTASVDCAGLRPVLPTL
jgi:hypothetical protein